MRKTAILLLIVFVGFLWRATSARSQDTESDKKQLIVLEEEWLHARDAATLDRILATDFVHPVAAGIFLTKDQHIGWYVKHLPPATRKTRFDQLEVRLYVDTAIVNGIVIASDELGKETGRSIFTDVFIRRDGRWQAVNAQENQVQSRDTSH
jgi:Domain of unknown function (DUF4440)